jgi:hypothetical protein
MSLITHMKTRKPTATEGTRGVCVILRSLLVYVSTTHCTRPPSIFPYSKALPRLNAKMIPPGAGLIAVCMTAEIQLLCEVTRSFLIVSFLFLFTSLSCEPSFRLTSFSILSYPRAVQ